VAGTQSDYYPLIARAIAALDENSRGSRQALYNRARAVQTTRLNNIAPALSVVDMQLECEALEQAIRTVEAEAAAADVQQAKSDNQIVLKFGIFMAENKMKPDCFYDAGALPYPKEAIMAAIERGIVRSPVEAHVNWLRSGAALLRNFQAGVGPDPLPFAGSEISQSQHGDTHANISALIPITPSLERVRDFEAIAERESKEIEERIAAAMRIRGAVRGEQLPNVFQPAKSPRKE
jgi:hypothetical protein